MDLHQTIRRILKEETQEPKILKLPSLDFFDKDPEIAWEIIQKIVERKGNPLYSIEGDLDLRNTLIESLGNLQSVGGFLSLRYTPIESLGNLQSVVGALDLRVTPISKKYTEGQIRQMVDVKGDIYL